MELLDKMIKIVIDMMGGPEEYTKWLAETDNDKVQKIMSAHWYVIRYLIVIYNIYLSQLDSLSNGSTSDTGKHIEAENQPLFPRFPGATTPATQPIPSEDEEDVPTRSVLKRQAQLLVDTKSRRKAFNFRR